jgi:DNA-directed RNA polymerase-3 subunit RPC5
MRPSFQHVDSEDQLETNLSHDMEQLDGPFEKKPVLFQRKESDRAILARKSSYAYQKTSEDSEPWIPLDVCLPRSAEHDEVMRHAYCRNRSSHVVAETASHSAYVQSLRYQLEGGASRIVRPPSSSPPLDMKSLVRQVASKLLGGGPVPFEILRASFASEGGVSDQQLLRALSVTAVLVRGNFVLNSRFLLAPSVPPNVASARTLILLLLERYGRFSRPQLDGICGPNQPDGHSSFRLSSERLLLILEQLAIKTPDGWVLKLPDDVAFMEQFPEQVAMHEKYWKKQESRFRVELLRFSESAPSRGQ